MQKTMPNLKRLIRVSNIQCDCHQCQQKRGGGSQLNNCFKFQRVLDPVAFLTKAYNDIIYIQVTLSSNFRPTVSQFF